MKDASLNDFFDGSKREEGDESTDESGRQAGDESVGDGPMDAAEPTDSDGTGDGGEGVGTNRSADGDGAEETDERANATASGDHGTAPDPTHSTYGWTPGGAECADCGATVKRRWRDDGRFVCVGCKTW